MTESNPTTETNRTALKKTSWKRRLVRLTLAFVVVWFIGDFAYSQYVHWKIRQWKAAVNWTQDGFTPDAEEFSLGEGETALLMVHGFSDTPQMFRKLGPAFAQLGYACRGILLPGFGRDVQAYADSNVEEWLAKLEREIVELRKTHKRVVIIAHSLGGAITVNHTLDGNQPADAVVLLAPAIEVSNARSPIFPTRFWHEFSKYALPSSNITYSPFKMDARDPAEQEREGRNRFSPRSVVTNTFRLIDENRNRAAEFSIPTLVFNAPKDAVIDPMAVEQFFSDCGSANKKLIQLENSGHMIPVDRDWKTIVSETDKFLSTSF